MKILKMIKGNKNVAIYFLSITSSIVGILLNFILARVLEAELYGEIQFLIALCTLLSNICIFGLNSFLIRESKNESNNLKIFGRCFSLYSIIFGFFLPIIFFFVTKSLSSTSYNQSLTIYVIGVSFLMGINLLISSYYQGKGKYHLSIIFENLIPKLLMLICLITFTIIGKNYFFQENYLLFYIIFYSTMSIPLLIKNLKGLNLRFTKAEIVSIFFFFGVTITYNLGNELTKILQGSLFKNNIALGTISVSTSILNLILIFTNVLNNLTKPIYAKYARSNDVTGIFNTYRFNTRLNSYIAIPFYLFLMLFSKNFLLLFGTSYTEYHYILTILALANAVSTLTGPNGSVLAMTGHEKWELFNGFIYFGIYIASVFIFSHNEIYGLSFALLVGQLGVNIAKYIECWKIFGINPLDKKTILSILIITFANLLIILPLLLIKIFWLWLLIGFIIGVLLILLNCFVFSLYRKTDFKSLVNLKL